MKITNINRTNSIVNQAKFKNLKNEQTNSSTQNYEVIFRNNSNKIKCVKGAAIGNTELLSLLKTRCVIIPPPHPQIPFGAALLYYFAKKENNEIITNKNEDKGENNDSI